MVTTASIVARRGWIIPAPFAIPPTVKPPRETTASFGVGVGGQDRLGRVGAAVRRELDLARARRAASASAASRRSRRSRGRAPAPARARAARAASAAVASASSSPCSPGGGVRDARVDHDRLRLGLGEVRLRDEHGRSLDAVGGEHPGADGGNRRADDARGRASPCRIPACTAPATKPFAAVTAPVPWRCARRRRPSDQDSGEPQPGGLVEAEGEVRVLHGLARGALAEIVDRADRRSSGRCARPRRRRPRQRRCPGAARGRARSRSPRRRAIRVRGLEQRAGILGAVT